MPCGRTTVLRPSETAHLGQFRLRAGAEARNNIVNQARRHCPVRPVGPGSVKSDCCFWMKQELRVDEERSRDVQFSASQLAKGNVWGSLVVANVNYH